jgi:type IV pilus assembly protein PilB
MAVEPAYLEPERPEAHVPLGTLLMRKGQLSVENLERALDEKERCGAPLGKVLVELDLITTRTLAEALAEQHALDFLDLEVFEIDGEAACRLPESLARRYEALPVKISNGRILVAVADPTNLLAHDDLRFALGAGTQIAVADRVKLDEAMSKIYGQPLDVFGSFSGTGVFEAVTSVGDGRQGAEAAPAISFVHGVIGQALAHNASDIHFEPQDDHLVVRVRVDGVTRELTTIPSSMQASVLARLKVMGGLDIAQRRAPQDGRVAVRVGGQPMDLRIAVLPTVNGEQIVLRILHRAFNGSLSPAELGMDAGLEEIFRQALARPYGAIITCGPTASGKTTTLYAALDLLNDPGRVLVTIEDPVEYQMPGVGQIEIDPLGGLTFARGLRTILRSDPDVILVGEIRDEETAHIAIQAASTGHLVLTTLHANSATSSIARLKDMGVDPGLLAPTLNLIVAQRLARRLCLNCREVYTPSEDERRIFNEQHGDDLRLYRATGCSECLQTGYQGRVALFEALPVDGQIRRLIDASTDEIFAAAVEQGMTTLQEAGLRLCLAGVSSLEEIRRVTGTKRL